LSVSHLSGQSLPRLLEPTQETICTHFQSCELPKQSASRYCCIAFDEQPHERIALPATTNQPKFQ